MMGSPKQLFTYQFEWDTAKARSNRVKHAIDFELAATLFLNPLAITIYDRDHNEEEDRWVTMGPSSTGVYCVVVHTWQQIDPVSATIRIISARRATKAEIRDYEETRR